jgi:drug/metabolite transporter (DMT)-like permease
LQALNQSGTDTGEDDCFPNLQTTLEMPVVVPATGVETLLVSQPPANLASRLGFKRADLLVLICVALWAVNVPSVKTCLQYFQPLEISLLRFITAGVLFTVYVRWREGSLYVAPRHLWPLLAAGLIGITLNQIFFVYALKNTTSSEVSLIMATTPSVATLLAWLLGQEKIRLNYWISLPIAVAGVSLIILTAPGATLGGGIFGDILAVFTASTWAAYTVMLRPLLKHYSPSLISAYVLMMGALALLPFGAGQVDFSHYGAIPLHIWLVLIYTMLGSVVITNILWFTGVKELGAPRTAFYTYLQPFLGVIAAFVILGEAIVPLQIGGGVLIVISMVLYRVRLRGFKSARIKQSAQAD